jgi:arylsulfatase A-like enzyme
MRRLGRYILAVLIGSVALQAAEPRHPRDVPNILLITVDTLRADHLSTFGYSRLTSPHIDRLARQGVQFDNAYTVVPLTGPSHISIMTSLYPQQHGAEINGMHMADHPRPITLAQILHRFGYSTAAFVSAWPLKKGITGLGRGFQVYNQRFSYHYKVVNSARTSPQVTQAAIPWLRKHAHRPFFMWVHYFDCHAPYVLHDQYEDLPYNPSVHVLKMAGQPQPDAATAQRIQAYDSEIAYTDHYVGELLGELSNLGIAGKTMVILMADHGESLGEHGYVGHGNELYQGIVHIPLIISFPGAFPEDAHVSADVSSIDVAPTILDLLRLPVARLPLEGHSLLPLVRKTLTEPDSKTFFLTYNEPTLLPPSWMSWVWTWAETKRDPSRLGMVKDNLKTVFNEDKKSLLLYQLDSLGEHEARMADISPSAQSDGLRILNEWFKRTNRGLNPESYLTQQDVEMLRSLGYVGP